MNDVSSTNRLLKENGFCVLHGVVEKAELSLLREETQAHLTELEKGSPVAAYRSQDGVPYRLENLVMHPMINKSIVAVRAHPLVLDKMMEYIGFDVVPYGSELVFKSPSASAEVSLHRDLRHGIFDEEHIWIAAGIYLDDADENNGCLHVIAGSHLFDPQDIAVATTKGLSAPNVEPVPVAAGEVLLHDARTLHGSPRSSGGPLRRVLYVSFQSAAWILREGLKRELQPGRPWIAENIFLARQASELRSELGYERVTGRWEPPEEWLPDLGQITPDARIGQVPNRQQPNPQ